MKVIDKFEEWAMVSMLVIMTGITFVQVVLRYVFGDGLTWALEFSMICFAFMIFLGISYGVRVGAHIGVDAAVKLLKSPMQRLVGVVAVVLSLIYVAMILTGSYEYVSKMKMVGIEFDDIPIERWQVLIVMPVGYCLVAFRFLQVLWRLLSGKDKGLHLADEAAEALAAHQVGKSEKSA
jgi:C4-dicarboxylate transporter DctQ subunit